MDIQTNIPLKEYLTMKLGGNARFMADAHSPEEVATLCRNARSRQLPIFILGSGSNSLAKDEGFGGLVIRNRIPGVELIADSMVDTVFRFGAGEHWDEVVKLSVERGLSGIEAMSAIPGTIGAAPVQNIGAYGQELADTFVSLEAYDIEADRFVSFDSDACQFSYRHSIFRGDQQNKYVILSVTLRFYKSAPTPPFYKAVQDYFDSHAITHFTPAAIREAVTIIRGDKLPDPALRPNSGSFFKNAIIEQWQRDDLLHNYPDMPNYDLGEGSFKIPTGWLIEQTGMKGQLSHGMRINENNALVLINESATSYADLAAARQEIIGKVRDQFRIVIEQEPLEI